MSEILRSMLGLASTSSEGSAGEVSAWDQPRMWFLQRWVAGSGVWGLLPRAECANEARSVKERVQKDNTERLGQMGITTAPIDWRFPTTNQAKHCYTRYNEFHLCVKERGEDDVVCKKYEKYFRSLCPIEWVERWDEQREAGTFAGPAGQADQ